ncbi:phosphate/phosphite/phosphonate ABC transporter substrate-binding protein [Ilumatobacter nonamiensis]|uniref:phosphate/phosphite/phosphonate ABC transporter substrate-binding protein n=1 Tax=Ilumatobacter nonamiensis TaxID=467093 RepID=UPI00034CACBA|nr:phosphate/phosphite/phosphonate ABC transporter substrate-binding protein [Ilumatobacter nonamiensis]
MNVHHSSPTPRRARTTLIALTASLALVGAACGSDDEASADEADSSETTQAADTETAATEAADTEAETEAETEATEAAATEATEAETETTEAAETEGTDAASGDVDTSDWPDSLVMGAVPAEESTALQESYDKLIQVLEADLGIEVEFFQATDYAGIIEAQVADRVDLAQYGPFAYVIAKNAGAEIEPVGALIEEEGEEPGYQSYGIVKTGSDITSLAEFADRQVCFVDPGSTSGFLYPSAGLIAEGIDPESGVTPVFAGGHDAAVISVDNGDCEAGFAFDAMVDNILIESGDIAEGDIETVWKSEVIAGSPIALRTGLPQSLVDEINRIVIEEANTTRLVERGICEDVETCGLTDENAWGWVPVDDSFYDGVRAVCDQTGAAQCEG